VNIIINEVFYLKVIHWLYKPLTDKMKNILTSILALVSCTSLSFAHCGSCEKDEKVKAPSAKVGAPAPDFTLQSADGSDVKLSDLKGKEVILEWVNFDCPFVKKHYNEGHMQALQKKYTEKGAVWLVISSANESHPTFKDAEALAKTAEKNQANTTHTLVDADGKVGKLYDAKTTPHMYVINKEGVLSYAGAIDSKKSTESKDIADSENYVAAALDAIMAGEKVKTAETKAYGCSVKY